MRRFETESENLQGCCICVAALFAPLYLFAKGLAWWSVPLLCQPPMLPHIGVAGGILRWCSKGLTQGDSRYQPWLLQESLFGWGGSVVMVSLFFRFYFSFFCVIELPVDRLKNYHFVPRSKNIENSYDPVTFYYSFIFFLAFASFLRGRIQDVKWQDHRSFLWPRSNIADVIYDP